MISEMTHQGTLVGDARTKYTTRKVLLRETKPCWVTGKQIGGGGWPLFALDLSSVVEIEDDANES